MDFLTLENFCAFAVFFALFISALGAFLPIIPGPTLGFVAILGFKLIFPDSLFSWNAVFLCALIAAAAQVLDFAFSWIGAKKMGASWRGALGAVLGAIVGIFIPPPIVWIFIAPFFGAVLFELLGGANLKLATKAGLGAFLGAIGASIFKFLSVVAMALIFYLSLLGQ